MRFHTRVGNCAHTRGQVQQWSCPDSENILKMITPVPDSGHHHLRHLDRRHRQVRLPRVRRPLHRRPSLHPAHRNRLRCPDPPAEEVTERLRCPGN
jgi:hypothetical protein